MASDGQIKRFRPWVPLLGNLLSATQPLTVPCNVIIDRLHSVLSPLSVRVGARLEFPPPTRALRLT